MSDPIQARVDAVYLEAAIDDGDQTERDGSVREEG
jgi:hypothetical protein